MFGLPRLARYLARGRSVVASYRPTVTFRPCRRCAPLSTLQPRPSARFSIEEQIEDTNDDRDSNSTSHETKKRKIALFLGYDGADFRGLQKQPSHSPEEFVEGVLESALYKAGLILETNYGSLNRIGATRSSRTDKGVSACGAVIGLKLELSPRLDAASVASADNGLQSMTDAVNAHLPRSVRVLYAHRMSKRWSARTRVKSRLYRYVVPTFALYDIDIDTVADSLPPPSVLQSMCETEWLSLKSLLWPLVSLPDVTDDRPMRQLTVSDSNLARLNDICQLFVGIHSMHNYTRLSNVKRANQWQILNKNNHSRRDVDSALEATATSADNDAEGESDDSGSGIDDEGNDEEPITSADNSNEKKALARLRSVLHRQLHSMTAEARTIDGVNCIVFTLEGTSFLYHQIRKTIAMVIAAYHCMASSTLVRASLTSPTLLALPLAPATGLLLDSNTRHGAIQANNKQQAFTIPRFAQSSIAQYRDTVLFPSMMARIVSGSGLADWNYMRLTIATQVYGQLERDAALMQQLRDDTSKHAGEREERIRRRQLFASR